MEINDTLKNRLAGTAVVTFLAIIFLPMMFDDPVEKKGQVVSELGIPQKPEVSPSLKTAIIPDKTSEVVASTPKAVTTKIEAAPAEDLADSAEKTTAHSKKTDAEPVDLEPEISEPTKKKAAKAEIVDDESVDEPKPAGENKNTKPEKKAEKIPSKPKLPVLDAKHPIESAASPAADGKRHWTIQVVSLNDEAKATAFRDKLRSQGFPATVESAWLPGKGRVFRLKVGPELDAQRAQVTKDKINQMNKVNSIAVRE